MRVRVLSSLLPLAVLVVPIVASLSSAACSSRVTNCAELGPDWTTCDNNSNTCVLAVEKAKLCPKLGGTATPATSGTTPAGGDAGVKCSAFEPTVCNGTCVDTRSDDAHCGGCNKPCVPSESCFAGKCQ
ncbi:MAG TPA: hypothetical protein PLR99_25765 [Polyangiaceae bacterium]|jgi:hypothetical protein|nr:hypothetical protein [Polyangiaceae bacterium]